MSSNSDISPNKAGQSFQIDGNLHDFLNFSLIWKFYSRNSDILLRGITLWKSREICFIYLIQFSKRMLSWHLYVVFFSAENGLEDDSSSLDSFRDAVPHTSLLDTSANRDKGQLAAAGNRARRPPSKRNIKVQGREGTRICGASCPILSVFSELYIV